jgi:hypothetical protein
MFNPENAYRLVYVFEIAFFECMWGHMCNPENAYRNVYVFEIALFEWGASATGTRWWCPAPGIK